MKEKNLVIFDLDGTLWDATEAIAAAWNQFFLDEGLSYSTSGDQIKYLAGRPYLDCLEVVTSRRDFDQDFLSRLNVLEKRFVTSSDGGRLIDEVLDGLIELQSLGYRLGIVSNCEEWYLQRFLDVVGNRIKWVATDCFGRSQTPKAEMLKRMNTVNGNSCLAYVGDTVGDLNAALASNVAFIGVTYGFGVKDLQTYKLELANSFSSVVKQAHELRAKN